MSDSGRTARVRAEKEKSPGGMLDVQEHVHAAHAARKDYILVKFLEEEDDNTLILNMSSPSCKNDWRVIEDRYYSELLEPGDIISVRASKKMDSKRRFYEAEVVEIKTPRSSSAGQEQHTQPRKKRSQRKPVSPSKRDDDLGFLEDLDGAEPAGKVQWVFDPYTGKRLDTVKTSTDAETSMQHGKARTGVPAADVKKKRGNGKGDVVMLEYSDVDSDVEENFADDEGSFSHMPHGKEGSGSDAELLPPTRVLPGSGNKKTCAAGANRIVDREPQAGFSGTKNVVAGGTAQRGAVKAAAIPTSSCSHSFDERSTTGQKKSVTAEVSGHKKTKRAEGRSVEQIQLLTEIKASLQSKGHEKCELFPGSHRYISKSRLNNLKVHWHLKHPMYDAVSLASMVFGSNENILTLFTGAHFGLKAALGEDVVRDLLGYVFRTAFINSAHPGITANREQPITADALYKAFSRRVWYLRGSEPKGQVVSKEGSPEV